MAFQFHFEWDPAKARQNARKHRVTFERGATVFLDPIPFNLAVDTPRSTLRIVSEDDVPFVWSVSRFPGFTAG